MIPPGDGPFFSIGDTGLVIPAHLDLIRDQPQPPTSAADPAAAYQPRLVLNGHVVDHLTLGGGKKERPSTKQSVLLAKDPISVPFRPSCQQCTGPRVPPPYRGYYRDNDERNRKTGLEVIHGRILCRLVKGKPRVKAHRTEYGVGSVFRIPVPNVSISGRVSGNSRYDDIDMRRINVAVLLLVGLIVAVVTGVSTSTDPERSSENPRGLQCWVIDFDVGQGIGMTDPEWRSCSDPTPMLAFVREAGIASQRKLRLFLCACCRRIWDWTPWHAVARGTSMCAGAGSRTLSRKRSDDARPFLSVRRVELQPGLVQAKQGRLQRHSAIASSIGLRVTLD
jgi:hypothetical protein